ncbi:MAG: 1-acyl-sn-glycerol-3-phosphate acyltransferase [Bacteriovoracaceae bacterium]
MKKEKKRRSFTEKEIEDNKIIYTQNFNPEYAISSVKNIFNFLSENYFRAKFVNFEKLPKRSNPKAPLIYVSNHSGMALPWDAMILKSQFLRMAKYNFKHALRSIIARELVAMPFLEPYQLTKFWEVVGGIPGTMLNFETMMRYQGSNILIYPEGIGGIGKGFNKKYQLQPFSTSYLRMALKYKTDIIPIYTINGEYLNPLSYSFKPLNKLVKKFGLPFLALGPLPSMVPAAPWLFYFAMPAKLTYIMGEPIKPYALLTHPYDEITEDEIKLCNSYIHHQMQKELDIYKEQYGTAPYKISEIVSLVKKNSEKLMYLSPTGWPLLFHQHDKLFKEMNLDPDLELNNGNFFKNIKKYKKAIEQLIPYYGLKGFF